MRCRSPHPPLEVWMPQPWPEIVGRESRCLMGVGAPDLSEQRQQVADHLAKVRSSGERLVNALIQYSVLLQMFRNSTRQTLSFQPLLREQPALIPVCTITKDRRDGLARTEPLSELVRCYDVQRGAGTEIETFIVENIVHHLNGLFVRDVQGPIDVSDERPKIFGNASLADT